MPRILANENRPMIRVRLNWWNREDKAVDLKIVLGVIIVGILFFFGIIFALASVYASSRLIVSVLFFAVGFIIIYVMNIMTKKPKTVIQRLEMSGEMKSVPLKCPNCSASIDTNQIKIVSGVPYATCTYCGQTFQVTEEPKW
ncbi:MAG: hypothetical protein PVF96_05370 [Candidatus Bathyarchaeota archaeon]|jgi:hypothetical protein